VYGYPNDYLNKTRIMKKAYGYARVSTKKQEEYGYSLEVQKEMIEDYCKREGYKLLDTYWESESGSKNNRPQLDEALNLCQLSDATLIVAKIDRLTRDLHFLTGLQLKGVKFLALDMPSANETMLQVMISFAEMDNKLRSIRIKEGMKKAKEKGKKFGTPSNLTTYFEQLENEVDPQGRRFEIRKELKALGSGKSTSSGKSNSVKLKLLKEEQKILEEIRNRRALKPTLAREKKAMDRARMVAPIVEQCESEGHTSLRQLAKCLNDKGITPPQAKEWTHANVQTLKTQLKKIKELE
jgi:DNA invertase Pin-like site-specific DNA recombinase